MVTRVPSRPDTLQGMTEAEEDKLLALKDFMLKSNKAKANMSDQGHLGEVAQSGVIDLGTLGITGRQVDLVKPKQEAEDKRGKAARRRQPRHILDLPQHTTLLLRHKIHFLSLIIFFVHRLHPFSIWYCCGSE